MDYMAQLARTVLCDGRTPPLAAVWHAIDARIAESAVDPGVWRAADVDARVELLADLFYRFPIDLAVPAACVLGFPDFIEELLDALLAFASEHPLVTTVNRLCRAQTVSHESVADALPSDIRTALLPLVPPRTGQRQAVAATEDQRREQRRAVLALLLGRPTLVRRLAEELQMAVPFSLAFARELDEVEQSRVKRSHIDPRAVIAGVERLIADTTDENTVEILMERRSELLALVDKIEAGDADAVAAFNEKARKLREAAKSHTDERLAPPDSRGAAASGSSAAASPERYSPSRAHELDLFGVAFSGGGIRSATLNLGVLQALAGRNVLPHVDYLSTVSGGGYVGSWLLAWIKRQPRGVFDVQRFLTRDRTPDPDAEHQRPVRFLREYSNYLTPRLGLLGADTWTMVSTLTRNTILNQLVLIAFLVAVLLTPRAMAGLVRLQNGVLTGVSLLAFLGACAGIGHNLRLLRSDAAPAPRPGTSDGDGQGRVQTLIVGPLFVSAVTLACAVVSIMLPPPAFVPVSLGVAAALRPSTSIGSAMAAAAPAGAAAVSLLGSWLVQFGVFRIAFAVLFFGLSVVQVMGGFGLCFSLPRGRSQDRGVTDTRTRVLNGVVNAIAILIASTISAATGGVLVSLGASGFARISNLYGVAAAITFGPPLLVLAFSAAGSIQIGLLGLNFPDERREWVSRLGGWLLIYAALWAAMFAGALFGPLWVLMLGAKLSALGGVAWIVSTIVGLRTGNTSKSPMLPGGWRDTLASAAMYVFVIGLVLLIALLIHFSLLRASGTGVEWSMASLAQYYWAYTSYDAADMTLLAAAAFALSLLLGWRIDVNEFSMHHFYKNRLVRCYLGASRAETRKPNAFTGFDPADDLKLSELRVEVPPVVQHLRDTSSTYVGPYPLINTTLNLVKGDNLAWQERKAASFVLTPLYCGYEVPPADVSKRAPKLTANAFRPTLQFAYARDYGIALGTAAAISGAAASPNQGYQSSPAAAFLMTMFNARLGWWIGNPRRDWKWRSSAPGIGLLYLLAELTGSTSDRSAFVNLSDGGHFDNLGLYELVRRRCRYIFAFDAEQDGDLTFGGLGGAVRKCRVDFGVDIDIQVAGMRHIGRTKRSRLHYAQGTIAYPNGEVGTLLYVKSSLTGDEPADVQQYAAAHAEFPHQTTADQWFSESQFESYRALGEHIVDVLCSGGREMPFLIDRTDVPVWFDKLQQHVRKQTPEAGRSAGYRRGPADVVPRAAGAG